MTMAKQNRLMILEANLQVIHDNYKERGKDHLSQPLNCDAVCKYLERSEKGVRNAFAAAKAKREEDLTDKVQYHNNLFVRFLDALLRAITFNFAHIPTKTESILTQGISSIHNKF